MPLAIGYLSPNALRATNIDFVKAASADGFKIAWKLYLWPVEREQLYHVSAVTHCTRQWLGALRVRNEFAK